MTLSATAISCSVVFVSSLSYSPTTTVIWEDSLKLDTRFIEKQYTDSQTTIVAPPDIQIFSTRIRLSYKVYTRFHATSEMAYSSLPYTVDNPLANNSGLSLRTGGQTMLYLSLR